MTGLMLNSHLLRSSSLEELAAQITMSSGPFVRISDAWQLLGYPSSDAARKAAARNRMPVKVFALPERRGKYVRSLELAAWLFHALNEHESPAVSIHIHRQEEDTA